MATEGSTEGEQLLCRRENNNVHDLFSVAMIMATSLFASLMADGEIIVGKSSLGSGEFRNWL